MGIRLEDIWASQKGSPTGARRALFAQIKKSLARTQGQAVVYSTFIATICVDTGLTRKTVEGVFDLLLEANQIMIDQKQDLIWLGVGKE